MVDPLDPDLALAFHWVVRKPFHLALKILSVIACAAVSSVIVGAVFLELAAGSGLGDTMPEWLFTALDWLFNILAMALGGYVGYWAIPNNWLIPNKDK